MDIKANFGRLGENVVAKWLRSRNNTVCPLRDIDSGELWKGPRLTRPGGIEVVAADYLVINSQAKSYWVEVKTKTRWSWYRNGYCWVTGIDQHYLDHYVAIAKSCDMPMWLLFLHVNNNPAVADQQTGCPTFCPTGLFGRDINELIQPENISHTHSNHGKGGMVYWRIESLKRLATAEELEPFLREEEELQNADLHAKLRDLDAILRKT